MKGKYNDLNECNWMREEKKKTVFWWKNEFFPFFTVHFQLITAFLIFLFLIFYIFIFDIFNCFQFSEKNAVIDPIPDLFIEIPHISSDVVDNSLETGVSNDFTIRFSISAFITPFYIGASKDFSIRFSSLRDWLQSTHFYHLCSFHPNFLNLHYKFKKTSITSKVDDEFYRIRSLIFNDIPK